MARRISDEPLATTLTADDVFLGNDGAVTKQFPASLLPGFSAGTFNIKDYGAVVDGTTVDSVAIQAAIAAANAAGGGEVLFPAGTTVTNVAISLSGVSKVTLRGVHRSASILKQASAANITTGVINATTAGSNLVIRDLGVDGNRAGQTVGLTTGIRFPSSTSTRVRITGCHVFNCGARGMSITGTEFEIDHNLATGCADAGIGLNEGADRAKIHHNSLNLNEGDGIYIGSRDNEASFNLAWDNRDTGINFGGPNDPTGYARIIGNECWLNDNSGLNTGGGDRTIISGNTCYANGRKTATPRSNAGIRVRDTTGTDPESGLNFAANHIIVTSNHCYDDIAAYPLASGALGQLYGVEVVDATSQATTDDPDQVIIVGNDLLGNVSAGVTYVNAAPTQVRLIGNLGVGDDGQAMVGGDLTGTVENAEIAAGAVGLAELATAAKPAANVKDPAYGAVGDARFVLDGVIGAGTLSTLTSATAVFTAGDVGKAVTIERAGEPPAAANGFLPHTTTIAAVTNSTTVTLTAAALRAVTAAQVDLGTDDSAAFQAAITAAYATGGPKAVHVPPGRYLVNTELTITSSLTFRGAGREVTTIVHPHYSHAITVTAPDASTVAFEDVTFRGSSGVPPTIAPSGAAVFIRYLLDNTYLSRLSARRIAITGTHDGGIQRNGGGLFEVVDCYLEATIGPVGVFESLDADNKMLFIARGTTFTTPNGDLTNQGSIGIYIHPHVPYIITGCRFLTLGRYGVYENGTPSSDRRPSLISGCEFVDCDIAKTETRGKTTITGCTSKGSISGLGSVLYGHQTVVSGCTFENSGPQTVYRSATFTGCTLINTLLTLANDTAATFLGASDCRFLLTSATGWSTSGIQATGTTGRSLVVDSCDFEDQTTSGSTSSAIGTDTAAGNHVIRNCRFRGYRATTSSVIAHRGPRMRVEGCEFDNTAQGTAGAIATQSANSIDGANNAFLGTTKFDTSDGTEQQRLVRRPGVNATTVASAATIDMNTTAWLNYDTHVISGSAAIATLSNPWVAVGAVKLVVAAGASWTTPSSGNITPLTTGARSPGQVITLLWEPTVGKWLETGTLSDLSTAVLKSIVDAKGDLVAATAADTVDRLAVGTANQMLTVDSTTSTGLKWAGTNAGAPLGYATGLYYMGDGAGDASYTMALNRFYVGVIQVPVAATFDRIGCTVTSAGTAGAVIRLGVYSVTAGKPGALVLDAGTVDSTSGGSKSITISLTLQPGYYFIGGVSQVATCEVRERLGPSWLTPQNAPGAENNSGWSVDNVTGALPNPIGAPGLNNDLIKVELRAA